MLSFITHHCIESYCWNQPKTNFRLYIIVTEQPVSNDTEFFQSCKPYTTSKYQTRVTWSKKQIETIIISELLYYVFFFFSNLDVAWWIINSCPYLFLKYSKCLCYFWQQDKWIWIVPCSRQSEAVCRNPISNVGYSVMAKIYSVLRHCAIICESWRHSRDDMHAVTTWNIF